MSNAKRLRTVPGLTPENICLVLADRAAAVPSGQAIVEIGVYLGRTVCYLGHGARLGAADRGDDPAHVYGIDPWDLPGIRPPARLGFTRPGGMRAAEAAIRAQGMRGYVTLIRGFSTEVAASWDGPKVGLLHVDGDHSYDSVRGDIAAWLPHLAEDATVAFDDYGQTRNPDVSRAVDDMVEEGILVGLGVYYERLAVANLPRAGSNVGEPVVVVDPDTEGWEKTEIEATDADYYQAHKDDPDEWGEPERKPVEGQPSAAEATDALVDAVREGKPPMPPSGPDLNGLTLTQLRTLAEQRGIGIPSGMRKQEIIDTIRAAG